MDEYPLLSQKPDLRIDLNSTAETSAPSPSYAALIAALKRRRLHGRSHSAPSLFPGPASENPFERTASPNEQPTTNKNQVWQAILGVALYLSAGITAFLTISNGYKAETTTNSIIDALYYTMVTLCTIGYGDIVPNSALTKLFACGFILVGFGFVGAALDGLVLHVCDRQEAALLGLGTGLMVDREKGRVRIRTKVVTGCAVVAGCVAAGTVAARLLEGLGWVDSLYLSVTSVTTVGYGDFAFATAGGRVFAAVWLPVSTLAVARAFLYFAELRIDKRNRRTAMWVLQKKVTLGDLVAADLDNDGSISKSEFVIYKLREMGKVSEKDVLQICTQFDSLEHNNCGKITLADILET